MKITKKSIGRWATVKFTDVGRRDVLLVDMRSDGDFVIYEPYSDVGLQHVTKDQIVEVRERQNAQ